MARSLRDAIDDLVGLGRFDNGGDRALYPPDADDAEESRRYLEAIVGDIVPAERRNTFLDRGPEVGDPFAS